MVQTIVVLMEWKQQGQKEEEQDRYSSKDDGGQSASADGQSARRPLAVVRRR